MTHSPRQLARAAGILYLLTHITSVTAVVAYSRGALRAGVTLEFALAIGCVGTGVLLWVLLRDAGPSRAAAFFALRVVEAAVIISGALPMLAAVLTPVGASGEIGFPADAGAAIHTASFLLGQGLIISVNTVVLAWLLWDTRAVPRVLAGLGGIGAVVVLASNIAQLWGTLPLSGALAGAAAVPIFVFEVWLAVYLIAFGTRPVDRRTDVSSTVGAHPA